MKPVIAHSWRRAALIALLACATLSCGLQISQGADPDSASPPRLLFTLDAAKCWSGPEAETVRTVSSVHPIVPTWAVNDLDKYLGISGDDVSRVVAFVTADGNGGVGILTSKPYDLKAVLAALAPAAKEETVAGHKYFSSPSGMAVLSLSDKELLISSVEGMPGVLKAKINKSAAADFVKNALAAKSSRVGLALRVRALREGVDAPVTMFEGLAALTNSNECTFSIEGDDKSLKVILRATYADETQAEGGAEGMKEFVEAIRRYMESSQGEMSKFFAVQDAKFPGSKALGERLNGASAQAEAALRAAKIERRGAVVEAQATIATKEPVTTAVLLSTLLPRAKKQPGEKNPGE